MYEDIPESEITVPELMAAAISQLAREAAELAARIDPARAAADSAKRVAQGLEADLNAAVESNRTLAESEAKSAADAETLRKMNATQASMILDRERQIREADERADDLERQIRGLEADLSADVARRHDLEARIGAAGLAAMERGEGVPKWSQGLTRDQVAAVMAAGPSREFISPWLHGRWTVVAILTPTANMPTANVVGTADIILRPAYGDADSGAWISGRIDCLQLDRAEF